MQEFNDSNFTDSIVEAIQDRKGKKITLLDLSQLQTSSAPLLIIAQGNTPTQVAAIADSVREQVQQKQGIKPLGYTGYRNATWIVLDYGSAMVHIFVPEAREFYALEQLWADATIEEIPDID